MRIVAGKFKGRAIAAPEGLATRPTGDRLRESIFNILTHGDYPLAGARVLDLFAGTGAMGLEALSRGAAFALFVDDAPEPRAAIRRNVEALGLTGVTKIFRRNATALGPRQGSAGAPYDLVFIDPPYGRDLVVPALASARDGGWLAAHATIVIETHANDPLALPAQFRLIDRRHYGGTDILLARHERSGSL